MKKKLKKYFRHWEVLYLLPFSFEQTKAKKNEILYGVTFAMDI